jgi:alpha-tubulin suppressor-like RCC1 family protein
VPVNGLVNAVAVTSGTVHSCAVLADRSARCWGRNTAGQHGNGTTVSSLSLSVVLGSGGSVSGRGIAAGREHTCAVRANGTVACWGRNDFGQIGDGTVSTRLTPTAVGGLANVTAVAAGNLHTCALLANGSVRCWGDNGRGQLGDGTLAARTAPVAVAGLANVAAITAGREHTCALLTDGTARCWGANGNGQLGDGTLVDRLAPVLPTLANVVALAAGEFHTCALLADGTARCWGSNANGQLGDGSFVLRPLPTVVSGQAKTVALAAGDAHSCALLVDGSGRCWGGNLLGQLGDGSTVSRTTPGVVSLLGQAVAAAAGFGHGCAVIADGTAKCWGENSSGQVGDATTVSRFAPTTVVYQFLKRTTSGGFVATAPVTQVEQIATGRRHSCLLRANGIVQCWGENASGQLGFGTTTNVAYPATVPSFQLNIDPSVALDHNDRVATVTILALCEAGQQLHLEVTLTQDGASGRRSGAVSCSDGLAAYPLRVPAQGTDGFTGGPGVVDAVARIVERGLVVDTQRWSRRVQLRTGP